MIRYNEYDDPLFVCMKNSLKTQKKEERKHTGKEKRSGIFRFLLVYFVLMGLFFFVMGFAPLQKYLDVNDLYSRYVVLITKCMLSMLHIQSSCYGTVIHLPGISLDVLFGCNGLEAVMIYSIAVIAFPARWKLKVIGILVGFIVIQLINVLRIVGLAYAAVNYKSLFRVFHIYVAQGAMIAIALGMFFIYLYYAQKNR